jgi:hypothetical protein
MGWLNKFFGKEVAPQGSNTVTNCIKEILKYVSEISKKHQMIADKYDNSSMSMAVIGALQLKEADKDLNEYLTTLDHEVLLKIEAVMFFGKFLNQDINDKYNMCVNLGQSKEDIVDLILSLTPACELYFEYALQQAKEKGINLDKF